MARETIAEKANRYLQQGRIIVTRVTDNRVSATARGEGHLYRVRFQWNDWTCDCEARGRCSHIRAVQTITAVDMKDPA